MVCFVAFSPSALRGLGSWGAQCSSHPVALYGWAVWMEWPVVCAREEGNMGMHGAGAGGVETGPRPTAHLQEFVGRLQAFPISRCKADWIHQFLSPRRRPLSTPHQPLLRGGQDISTSNTKYGTELDVTTLSSLLTTLLHTQKLLAVIPWPEPKFALRHEQPRRSRGIPSRPIESFINGPYHRPNPGAREALFVEADTADARPQVGDRNHQVHQRRSTKRATQPHFIHFTYNLEFGSSSP